MAQSLKDLTVFITGASRGIGKAIALRCAEAGANIVIAAKTADPHPKLEGTIYTTAEEIEALGSKALPVVVDVRDEASVQKAVNLAASTFGGIDILVNNASAINLSGTEHLEMKRYDLMHQVNARGTFLCSKLCFPHLKESSHAHILNLSPPLNFEPRWFGPHVAYSMAKYGMSLCVLGMAEEFKNDGIKVNALWPRTTIATAAVNNLLGGDKMMQSSRTPKIMADAAYFIFNDNSSDNTGNFYIDDEVMQKNGIEDLRSYQVDPDLAEKDLTPDFFV